MNSWVFNLIYRLMSLQSEIPLQLNQISGVIDGQVQIGVAAVNFAHNVNLKGESNIPEASHVIFPYFEDPCDILVTNLPDSACGSVLCRGVAVG